MTTPAPVEIAFRIPGKWHNPGELIRGLPPEHSLTEKGLTLPDGTTIECSVAPPDDQFADIFRTSLRQPASEDELATVRRYTVNVLLCGPGGSLQSALTMMQAAAAIVEAGGAGVFIDNSGLSHGGQDWLEMTADGGPDAVSFAFVTIVRGKTEVWTMGMHVLGLRDLVMKRSDVERDGFDITEVIRYLASGEHPVGDGHLIGDLEGPRFRASEEDSSDMRPGSPLHNPFGRLRLVSMKDIAETN